MKSLLLAQQLKFLNPALYLLGLVVLLRGANHPGGGLVAGFIFSLPSVLSQISREPDSSELLARRYLSLMGLGIATLALKLFLTLPNLLSTTVGASAVAVIIFSATTFGVRAFTLADLAEARTQ